MRDIKIMNTVHSYESLSFIDLRAKKPERLTEGFDGVSIVRWYGRIEGQLVNMLDELEKGRNYAYGDKVRAMLQIWRDNELTGSINRETLDTLHAATLVLAKDTWTLQNYFHALNIELKALVASAEELPRTEDGGNDPFAGGGGGGGHGGGGPPMSPDFGPQSEMPGGLGGEEGGPGGAGGGAGGGAVGADLGGPEGGAGPEGAEGAEGGPEGAAGPSEEGGPQGGAEEPAPEDDEEKNLGEL